MVAMKVFSSLNDEVAQMIKAGAVGIMPTDTIYGLAARLDDKAAVEKIYHLKDRNYAKAAGTILIGDIGQIKHIVSLEMLSLAEKYWPGAVSVILPVGIAYEYAHHGLEGLAFRLPEDDNLRQFLLKIGPLATSSANLEGQPPAKNIEEAMAYFGDKVDFYVDIGELDNPASQIIKINQDGSSEVIRG